MERAGDGRENLARTASQQIADVGPQHHRDEHGRADERHGEQRLKRRFGDELDRDRRPVGCGQERAAFQQELDVQNRCTNCMLFSGERGRRCARAASP